MSARAFALPLPDPWCGDAHGQLPPCEPVLQKTATPHLSYCAVCHAFVIRVESGCHGSGRRHTRNATEWCAHVRHKTYTWLARRRLYGGACSRLMVLEVLGLLAHLLPKPRLRLNIVFMTGDLSGWPLHVGLRREIAWRPADWSRFLMQVIRRHCTDSRERRP